MRRVNSTKQVKDGVALAESLSRDIGLAHDEKVSRTRREIDFR